MTAQIITFPIKNARVSPKPPDSEEDIMTGVDSMKLTHVNETLLAASQMLFERLYSAGFDFSQFKDENELKYGSFLVEAMNSLLCKYYDVYHPFQDLAEKIFVRDENDEFTIADELNMRFIDTSKKET
jgi:hypothetical protein